MPVKKATLLPFKPSLSLSNVIKHLTGSIENYLLYYTQNALWQKQLFNHWRVAHLDVFSLFCILLFSMLNANAPIAVFFIVVRICTKASKTFWMTLFRFVSTSHSRKTFSKAFKEKLHFRIDGLCIWIS